MEWTISDGCTLNGMGKESISKEDILDIARENGWKNFKVLLNGIEIDPSHPFPITNGNVEVKPINLAA